jgi:hypothetical protein
VGAAGVLLNKDVSTQMPNQLRCSSAPDIPERENYFDVVRTRLFGPPTAT